MLETICPDPNGHDWLYRNRIGVASAREDVCLHCDLVMKPSGELVPEPGRGAALWTALYDAEWGIGDCALTYRRLEEIRAKNGLPADWCWGYPPEHCAHDYTHERGALAIAMRHGKIAHPVVCGLCGGGVRHVRLGRGYSLSVYTRAMRRTWADRVATVAIADLHAGAADVLPWPVPEECCGHAMIVAPGGCSAACPYCNTASRLTYEMTFTAEPYWVRNCHDLPRDNYYELPEPSKSAATVFARKARRQRELWSLVAAFS